MPTIDGILTIVQDKKKQQLAGVLLSKYRFGGRIHIWPYVAMTETRKKKFELFKLETWAILNIPEPLDEETIKFHMDSWVNAARDNTTVAIIASSIPFRFPGVKVEQFAGQNWPSDWEAQGKAIFKDKKAEINGSTLKQMLRYKPTDELVQAFYGALWLAWRFNFFAVTPEQAQHALLYKGGASAVSGYSDLRGGPLSWRQPYVSGPAAPSSPLARPQSSGSVSIFSPGYKGRK